MALSVRLFTSAALLLCAGCSSLRQRSGTPIDPALVLLTPADTTSLVWIKMEKLVKTPGFDHFAKSGAIGDWLDLLAAQTTYDPRKDFWEVLVVSNGSDYAMLARGQFAPLGMEPEFKKVGSRRTAYRGQTLISTNGVVLTFMSPSCLAVGTRQSLEHLVDAHAGKRGGPPAALLERAEKIDRKNQVWWASTSPATLLPKQVPAAAGGFSNILANLPRLLNGVHAIGGSMDFSAGISASIEAVFADPTQARESATAVQAFLALARATLPKASTQRLGIYDSVKVEQAGSTWRVLIDAPMAVLTQPSR
jgi:hypothetical protein